MKTDELKFVLALEPTWTVSCNGLEFQPIASKDIEIQEQNIRLGKWARKIEGIEWLRPNVVRIRARQKVRSKSDIFTLYPGERLPPAADLRRRRRFFQRSLGLALKAHFGSRSIEKQTLYSDKRYGIGGAYPRFVVGNHPVIAVDPDEPAPTVNAVMRAALLWRPLVRRRLTVVVPQNRSSTVRSRLAAMPKLLQMFEWLDWDGEKLTRLSAESTSVDTQVHDYYPINVQAEIDRIASDLPFPVQPVLNIAGGAISIRFRGIDIAIVREHQTEYPLGEPLRSVVEALANVRKHGSIHPLARAHEERWLESNLVGELDRLLPSIDLNHIYPQVPSFVGEERNIIDMLTVTREGRLVVMEIKASADPDLPFQALDYWIAVERHRKAGDFQSKGYFKAVTLRDEPALLVLVAPLLAFHKTFQRLISVFPSDLPLIQIGLNQTWKKEIKILRRQGLLS